MRLRSLELDQFRKFDRRVRLDGLGAGINVLCGPNEHGKSTLLAALRAVLFDRHTSRGEGVRGHQHHRNATAPTVALEFEHDGASHRIEKRFLSRASARLVSAGTAYDGDAAEERLAQLLGVSMPARATRDGAEAATIWAALLVSQGDGQVQARLGDGARLTLSECLEAELGSVTGGAAVARLLKPVQAGLGLLLDARGHPRERYKAAVVDHDAAEAEIRTLQDRRQALDADLAALLGRRRELAAEADPATAERAVTQLLAARRHREALLGHAGRLQTAHDAVRLAETAHDDAGAEQARRAAAAAELAATMRRLAELSAVETDARARANAARQALAGRRSDFDRACEAHDAAERALRASAAGLDIAERAQALDAARTRLATAEAAAAQVAECAATLARMPVDVARLDALHAAARAARADQAALQAQATSVELSLTAEALLQPDNGAPTLLPAGPHRLSLSRPAILSVAGLGTVRIVPASRDQEALHAEARDSARALAGALAAVGCRDVAEAERAHLDRRDVATNLEQTRRALDAAIDGKRTGGLDGLRRQTALLEAELADRIRAGDAAGSADPVTARVTHAGALAVEAACRDDVRLARTALLTPEADRDLAEATLRQAELDRGAQETIRDARQTDRARREAAEADTDLAARLQRTTDALADRRRELAALAAAAPDGTLAMADAGIRRLEEAHANRQSRTATLREEIARLESGIATEAGIGLDEQIEAAQRRGEAAAALRAGHAREAAILTLLRDTLLQADREARERTVAPLMTRIGPYLQALFPRAELRLGENFQITALTRPTAEPSGGAADADDERFDLLSHGTREQIAILARLAFADMLLASGRPAFLVLDDALTFADPARMERMFDILTDAGRRMQILVLTCRDDIAAGLGGTRVALTHV